MLPPRTEDKKCTYCQECIYLSLDRVSSSLPSSIYTRTSFSSLSRTCCLLAFHIAMARQWLQQTKRQKRRIILWLTHDARHLNILRENRNCKLLPDGRLTVWFVDESSASSQHGRASLEALDENVGTPMLHMRLMLSTYLCKSTNKNGTTIQPAQGLVRYHKGEL